MHAVDRADPRGRGPAGYADRMRLPRPPELLVPASVVAAVAALWAGPLFLGNTLYFRDLQLLFVPMRAWVANGLAAGTLPLWDPGLFCGTSVVADVQAGLFYPPTLIGLLPHGFAVGLAAHVAWAGIGTARLARGRGPAGAAVAGLGVALGGVTTSAFSLPNVLQTFAWFPWTILAFGALERSGGRRAVASSAACVWMLALAGEPFLAAVGLALALTLPGPRSGAGWMRALGAVALGLAAAAPQLVASYDAWTRSARADGVSGAEIAGYTLQKSGIVSLVRPPALRADDWEVLAVFPDGHVPMFLSLYVGVPLMLLALAGSARAKPWLVVAALGLALATDNPATRVLFSLMRVFRYPEKLVVLADLGLPLAAAAGVEALRERFGARVAALAPLLVAADLLLVNRAILLQGPPGWFDLGDLPAVQTMRAAGGGRVLHLPGDDDAPTVRGLHEGWRAGLAPNLGRMAGVEYFFGNEALNLRDHVRRGDMVSGRGFGPELAAALGFFGVRWVSTPDPRAASGLLGLADVRAPGLYELRTVAPRLSVAAVVDPVPDHAIAGLPAAGGWIGGRAVTVSEDVGFSAVGVTGSAAVVSEAAGELIADVSASAEALVVWRSGWDPGWNVTVDDVAVPAVRVDGFFLGARVPAGAHRVAFRYWPGWLVPAMGVALAAVMGMLALRGGRETALRERDRGCAKSTSPATSRG